MLCRACFFCLCDNPPSETVEHILHDCPGFEHHRTDVELTRSLATMPNCTRLCGIALHKPCVTNMRHELQQVQEPPPDPLLFGDSTFCPGEAINTSGQIVVYTDGACRRQAHEHLRRAGSGAWWFDGSPRNVSCPLPGSFQTNQRAELLGAVLAAERDSRPLEIRTDSKYVVDGTRKLQAGLSPGTHLDLWARLAPHKERLIVTKVLGHATWKHVRDGHVSMADKIGNAMADKLAVAGAEMHANQQVLEQVAREGRNTAMRIQRRFVNILAEHEMLTKEIYECRRLENPPVVARRRLHRFARRRAPVPTG